MAPAADSATADAGTLSVIIANYNHARYVGGAVEALLTQSVRPFEVIVVDDASTDNSLDVLETLAKRDPIVRVIRNEHNLGTIATQNRGIAAARGRYVFLGGADDAVLPGFVERSLGVLADHAAAGMAWSDNMTLDVRTGVRNANSLRLSNHPCCFSASEIVELLRRGDLPCLSCHSAVLKRSAVLEAGAMRPELRWYHDQFLATVVALRHGACYVPEVLTCARIHESAWRLAGHQEKAARRAIFLQLVALLRSPEYADVRPLVKRSGILGWYMGLYDFPMLAVSFANPEYRDCLSGTVVRRAVWYAVKNAVSRIAPPAVKRLYYGGRDRYRRYLRARLRRSFPRDGAGEK